MLESLQYTREEGERMYAGEKDHLAGTYRAFSLVSSRQSEQTMKRNSYAT